MHAKVSLSLIRMICPTSVGSQHPEPEIEIVPSNLGLFLQGNRLGYRRAHGTLGGVTWGLGQPVRRTHEICKRRSVQIEIEDVAADVGCCTGIRGVLTVSTSRTTELTVSARTEGNSYEKRECSFAEDVSVYGRRSISAREPAHRGEN
jgi:hypothetical protein